MLPPRERRIAVIYHAVVITCVHHPWPVAIVEIGALGCHPCWITAHQVLDALEADEANYRMEQLTQPR